MKTPCRNPTGSTDTDIVTLKCLSVNCDLNQTGNAAAVLGFSAERKEMWVKIKEMRQLTPDLCRKLRCELLVCVLHMPMSHLKSPESQCHPSSREHPLSRWLSHWVSR